MNTILNMILIFITLTLSYNLTDDIEIFRYTVGMTLLCIIILNLGDINARHRVKNE